MPDEQIEALVLLEREYLQEKGESPVFAPAKLLMLTTYGLTIVEEGFVKIAENYMGYKVQHITYNKITNIELDVCLLSGRLRISTSSNGSNQSEIQFNTAKYYRDFEDFIDALRKKIVLL